jgi:hypothetical protein
MSKVTNKETGEAEINIKLSNGIITIKNSNKLNLKQWEAHEGDWDKLWNKINELAAYRFVTHSLHEFSLPLSYNKEGLQQTMFDFADETPTEVDETPTIFYDKENSLDRFMKGKKS